MKFPKQLSAAYFETFRWNFSLNTNPKIGTSVVV